MIVTGHCFHLTLISLQRRTEYLMCQVWGSERGAHAGTGDQADGQNATENRAGTAGSVRPLPGLSQLCRAPHHLGLLLGPTSPTPAPLPPQHNSGEHEERGKYVLEVFIDYKMGYALKFCSYFVHEPTLFSGYTCYSDGGQQVTQIPKIYRLSCMARVYSHLHTNCGEEAPS